jgi:hypothetical protein
MHTTRRAQVLGQKVFEQTQGMLPAEKVFLRTTPKPIETSQTFPDSIMNGQNKYETFLDKDPHRLKIFKNFKNLSRDLTKAFLRQAENKDLFNKA